MSDWRRCAMHPDVNPQTMWGCPDCIVELRAERNTLAAALKHALDFLKALEQWDDPDIRPFMERAEQLLRELRER